MARLGTMDAAGSALMVALRALRCTGSASHKEAEDERISQARQLPTHSVSTMPLLLAVAPERMTE